MRSEIVYPTALSSGPLPLIVFLHGQHLWCHNGVDAISGWKDHSPWCPADHPNFINSYQGYNYLARSLASHGYIVVSISANGVNAGSGRSDRGMQARAQLIDQHLLLWNQWNNGQGLYGSIFQGKVDLQNVGLMGHSRGGEGITEAYLNQDPHPYKIQALLPLAPTDFQRLIPNNVAMAVVLSYCDGDVLDLQGVHYFDDTRYLLAQDLTPKHSLLVMGANHNFYNTIWSPSSGIPEGKDDWVASQYNPYADQDAYCSFLQPGNGRLDESHQRATAIAYVNAFFRNAIRNNNEPSEPPPNTFFPYLTGDSASPPSAQGATVHASYHAPSAVDWRLDLNRLFTSSELTTNDVLGPVIATQLTPYTLCGGAAPEPPNCLPATYNPFREPHTSRFSEGTPRPVANLSQLNSGWTDLASYENVLPPGQGNVIRFETLQFRVGVNFADARNLAGLDQDFTVMLQDGGSRAVYLRVGTSYANRPQPMYYPPGSANLSIPHPVPHLILNTVRIPLKSFTDALDGRLDLTDIRSVKFVFDQRLSGALLFSDIGFTNSFCPTSPPPPTPTPCSTTDYKISAAQVTATIVPGTTDIQNSCDDCTTQINLPFPVTLYDRTFTTANADSNGDLQFDGNTSYYSASCLPDSRFSYTIFPHWSDLVTDIPNKGIFTSVSGSAPNRILNIEWRACYYVRPTTGEKGGAPPIVCNNPANFEVRLHEGRSQFDLIYGSDVPVATATVVVGVQRDSGSQHTLYTPCPTGGSTLPGIGLTFTQPPCALDPCPIQFQDVPAVQVFAPFISDLACRNVVNGYSCGVPGFPCVCPTNDLYFDIYKNVTRGQVAKLVAQAVNFAEAIPCSQQTFTDVLPNDPTCATTGNPFWRFIESLAGRGYVIGYDDHTFRPYKDVTRGALTKIVVNAAGYADQIPCDQQTFTDVAPCIGGNVFWIFVERASRHGVISGYTCGGFNPQTGEYEPCDSAHRPYFRPNGSATRGQTAKIIDITFFRPLRGKQPPQSSPAPTGTVPLPLPVPTGPAVTGTVPLPPPVGTGTIPMPSPDPTGPVSTGTIPVPSPNPTGPVSTGTIPVPLPDPTHAAP